MTPLIRWLRTLGQVLVASSPAVPAATATGGVDAATAGKIVAVVDACVLLVSGLHNLFNARSSGSTTPAPASPTPATFTGSG